ncbi:MAG: PAS domain S-box protein [Deltaproteobacteria bacterium]|jgi:PAS domain S-box-containing protein
MDGKPRSEARQIGAEQVPEAVLKERYVTILEGIQEAYFEVDLKGNLTVFNDSLCKSLGYPRDELMGMSYRDFMPPETAQEIFGLFNKIYRTGETVRKYGYEVIRKDKKRGYHELFACLISDPNGEPIGFRGIAHEVTERKLAEEERETLLKELQSALAEVKRLSGLLPICAHCKKIRDDKGYWNAIEDYIKNHSDAEFSHSICPECAKTLYPDYDLYENENTSD